MILPRSEANLFPAKLKIFFLFGVKSPFLLDSLPLVSRLHFLYMSIDILASKVKTGVCVSIGFQISGPWIEFGQWEWWVFEKHFGPLPLFISLESLLQDHLMWQLNWLLLLAEPMNDAIPNASNIAIIDAVWLQLHWVKNSLVFLLSACAKVYIHL